MVCETPHSLERVNKNHSCEALNKPWLGTSVLLEIKFIAETTLSIIRIERTMFTMKIEAVECDSIPFRLAGTSLLGRYKLSEHELKPS